MIACQRVSDSMTRFLHTRVFGLVIPPDNHSGDAQTRKSGYLASSQPRFWDAQWVMAEEGLRIAGDQYLGTEGCCT